MNKLEKFYGFNVSLTDNLDPLRVEALEERAFYICNLYDYEPNQFHVYYHLLSIINKNQVHLGIHGLKNRLKYLSAGFSVNQKQTQNKQIRFFNYLVDGTENEHIKSFPSPLSLRYQISANYFESSNLFRNEIITFISNDIPDRHRKIKVTLVPVPTDDYKEVLHRENLIASKVDFKFRKSILLSAPSNKRNLHNSPLNNSNSSRENIVNKYYTFNAPVSNVGDGTNVNVSNIDIVSAIKEFEDIAELGRETGQLTVDESQTIIDSIEEIKEEQGKLPKNILVMGKKLIDISEKIGCNIAAALIKNEMGM